MAMYRPPLRWLSQQNDGEEEEEEGSFTVRIVYLSLVGSSCFILEFVFDFKKDNLMILGYKISLFLSKTNSP